MITNLERIETILNGKKKERGRRKSFREPLELINFIRLAIILYKNNTSLDKRVIARETLLSPRLYASFLIFEGENEKVKLWRVLK